MRVLKSIRFWIPFLLLISLIIGSFLVPVFIPDFQESGPSYMTDEETGKVIAAPPYSISEMPPLGSDKLGRNLFVILVAGAKYTLISAIVIALLRMAGGFTLGILYAFLPRWIRKGSKGILDTFNFIPLAIVVYILLFPLQQAFVGGALSSFQFLIIEVIVISLIVFPSLGMYVGQGMNDFLRQDFISVSRTMGATRFHLIRKHLWPQFSRQSIVLFSEQLSQTLLLLVQLGILHITLGGLMMVNFGILETIPEYFSVTNEWAATMSINIQQIFNKPLLLLAPLLFFAVSIYCVNVISSVLRSVLIEGEAVRKKKRSKVNTESRAQTNVGKEHFQFMQTGKRRDLHG
ncbi:ABC transporter permease subunit [Rossellomorea aquimaris]|uniref:ABC transporter permease subunit n=1 Tax=Rossellomorea aquimaris TaxID=189382 RepID=UPI001CD1AB6F|nr:ABC transporter permease subunit [Rossellomorea aquimaris]MCA1055351.1 ABC transporter permease subunit [Rossellomorea aquimaris]